LGAVEAVGLGSDLAGGKFTDLTSRLLTASDFGAPFFTRSGLSFSTTATGSPSIKDLGNSKGGCLLDSLALAHPWIATNINAMNCERLDNNMKNS
jgi:hypothetical protein